MAREFSNLQSRIIDVMALDVISASEKPLGVDEILDALAHPKNAATRDATSKALRRLAAAGHIDRLVTEVLFSGGADKYAVHDPSRAILASALVQVKQHRLLF